MKTWISFKELREKLDFEKVLRHYEVEVRRKGNQHHGFCPLPDHKGNKRSPSFSANLERGLFQCFGCGAKGNVLDFAALMERTDPADGQALHKVAIKLRDLFCPTLGQKVDTKPVAPEKPRKEAPAEAQLPVVANAPLDFELKGLDHRHPYLTGRGFTQETIDHFGLGYAARGSLKGRIAIPLHDQQGKLVGYAGRVVDDSAIGEENPRYRFPSKRVRKGTCFEFHKTLFLYNGFRIQAPVEDLIVVEGFTAVWWLHQSKLPNVVATMGADCADKQAELIVSLVKPTGRVWIMPDGDEAGTRGGTALLLKLSPHRFVRWVKLPADKQPTDLSAEELRHLMGGEHEDLSRSAHSERS